jgi:hypothetical protein
MASVKGLWPEEMLMECGSGTYSEDEGEGMSQKLEQVEE